MQLGDIKKGARVTGTTTKGRRVTGTVTAIDTSGKRGAFIELDGAARFRPSQVEPA